MIVVSSNRARLEHYRYYTNISHYYSFKIFPRFWLIKTTRIIYHNPAAVHQIWKESSPYWINDVKSTARFRLLNQWRQNDVKSTARFRLLNRWRQNDVKSAARFRLLNQWRQNDVKSTARFRLLNQWRQNDVKSTARFRLLNRWRQNDVKSTARFRLLNRWRQNDVKSAARYRLLNPWPRKPGGAIMLFLVSEKKKERNGETPLRTGKYFEWIIKQLLNSAFVGY